MPVQVRVAAYIELGLAALGFILLAFNLLSTDWNAYIADSVGPYEHNGAQLEVTPEGAVATAVVGLVLVSAGVLLNAVFAVGLLRGANWARIWITVLFGLSVIAQFVSARDPVSVVTGLLELVAVILLWLPPSNQFFRSVKQDRAIHRSRRLV
ncbi:hypothetical protein [Agromyces binzhouensis]|uniref:hypothetical protein n=1 Tax=Agromyces binzhouensis TaxID=1817495 RepID=UPI00363FD605